MSYLAKLKQIESNENFDNAPGMVLPKPPKPPFGIFGSSNTMDIEKNIIDDSELKREERRQKVLKMLADNPTIQRAFITDLEADPDRVILTLAIRSQYTFEMQIPKDKYDAFTMLELTQKGVIQ